MKVFPPASPFIMCNSEECSFIFTMYTFAALNFMARTMFSYVACLAILLNCIIIYIFIYELFFLAESYFDSRIASSFFILFFFREKTLGDISSKLETNIMNFVTGFFFGKNNIKSTQVLSIICNTICLQFSHYQAPLQSLGLVLLITSRISDFKCHSY